MTNNDFTDEMNEFEGMQSDRGEAEGSLDINSFQRELETVRKKERKKMLFVGFLAGIVMTVGVAMYVLQANADTAYNSESYDSGSGYNGSYASYSSQSAGAAGAAGGGCCGGGSSTAGATGSASLGDLEKQALKQFEQEKGSSKDVTAKATDYGCHTQIDIKDKTGKIVRSYGYQGNQLYVIS